MTETARVERRMEVIRYSHVDWQKINDSYNVVSASLKDAIRNFGSDLPSTAIGPDYSTPEQEPGAIEVLADDWRRQLEDKANQPAFDEKMWRDIDNRLRNEGFDPTTDDERQIWTENPPDAGPLPSDVEGGPVSFFTPVALEGMVAAYESMVEMGEAVIDWSKERLEDAERLLQELDDWFDSMLDRAYDLALDLADSAADALQKTWEYVSDQAEKLSNTLADIWKTLEGVGESVLRDVNDFYRSALGFIQRRDPLTLDLDGDGIETISANSGITFDFDGDGLKTGTGWVKGDDGFLVLDRNGNGSIDTGRELFGVDTVKANGQKASDGFDALRDLDGNADGVFDAQDAQFANVRVWQDANQDGVAQASELKTLAEHDISAINLDSTATSQNSNGNLISATGSFVRSDGAEGSINDNQSLAANLDLASNPFYREHTDSIELDSAAQALPDMQGSGAVRDLREAAMLDAGLKSVLSQYSQAQTREQQMALLDKLLAEWASSSSYKTWDQRIGNLGHDMLEVSFAYSWERPDTDSIISFSTDWSSGEQGTAAEDSGPTAAQLAQKQVLERIKILEIFNGQNFFNFSRSTSSSDSDPDAISTFNLSSGSTTGSKSMAASARIVVLTEEDLTINAGQAALLNQAYDALLQSVYDGLLLQTRLKPYVDAIELNLTMNGIELDYSGVEQKFIEAASQNVPKALLDLMEFKKNSSFAQALSVDFLSLVLTEWVEVLTPDESNSIRAQLGQNSTLLLGSALADQLKGSNLSDQLYGGAGDDILDGGTGSNHLYGGSGNDVLKVHYNAANNLLAGGTGGDSLYGSHNSDTYVFNLGDGVDTIIETSAYSGAVDTLRFGADLSPEQLWFQRNGNNLDILVEGSSDRVTVSNWYASSGARIEQMQTSGGLALTESRVQNLVDAMAAFGVPPGGESSLTADQRAQLDVVIAANWQ